MDFSDFSSLFVDVVKSIMGPLYKEARASNIENYDALEDIYRSFSMIGQYISGADGIIHISEATILSKLTQLIPGQEFRSAATIQRLAANRTAKSWEIIESIARRKPIPLQMIEIHDEIYKTNHYDNLCNLYLYFAILMAKADGIAQIEEIEYIEELKIILKRRTLGTHQEEKNPKNIENKVNNQTSDSQTNLNLKSKARSIDEIMSDFKKLVGLDPVKKEVENLVNIIKINNMRKNAGLPTISVSNHLVFMGNPGTGKTTVARLIAEAYKSFGILRVGHLVETDRSGMVAGYVGQTAIQVKKIVESALGGVLFVDEAYALSESNGNDYGREAINTLLKLMEDYRSDLAVIVAGYPDKMLQFLESNPGLKSRFNRFLNFPDYTSEEMLSIFEGLINSASLNLSPEARQKSLNIFKIASARPGSNLGNARFARNLFENSVSRQSSRLINMRNLNEQDLQKIESEDIEFPSDII